MTTFDDVERTRTSRLGSDWVTFLDGKYGRQQTMSLVGRLSVYFVHCGRGQMLLELQSRGRLWRVFAGFEMLEIRIDD